VTSRRLHLGYVSSDRGVPVLGTKGGSTHVRELVNAFGRRGADVSLVAARMSDGATAQPIDARLVEVAPGRFPRSLREAIRAAAPGERGDALGAEMLGFMLNEDVTRALRREHARRPIDAVYERYSLWGWAGLTFARTHGIPYLLEVNAPLRLEQARWRSLVNTEIAEGLESQLFRTADRVIVPSSAVRAYVVSRGARQGRVRVIPNAADVGRFRPPTQSRGTNGGPFTVGFVGSLKPWHGIDDLLRAFVRLHRRDAGWRLLVVGDGPLRPTIERVVRTEGLRGAVRVTGTVDYATVPALVHEMDVAVAPYPRLPGFYFSPLKIFEYMAARRAIVASDIGQVAEVLTHRRTALLHPPGSISKMVAHLEELRARPRLRERLAREARRLAVARFTWDRNAARVLATIDTLRRTIADVRHAAADEPVL